MIDLVLAGDNAVVIGLAAAGLPQAQRARAILVGIVAATVLRIVFARVALELLRIVGLLLAGGILLLWVCLEDVARIARAGPAGNRGGADGGAEAHRYRARPSRRPPGRSWWRTSRCRSITCWRWPAPRAIIPAALVFGLGLSIVLMGVAASLIARLLNRHRWIAYVGLAIILYVALDMIWRGVHEVWPHLFRLKPETR